MTIKEIVKKVSKEYKISEDTLLKQSIIEFLITKKRDIEIDIIELASKYGISDLKELEKIVQERSEHPAWEELIVLENLHIKLDEINRDIAALQ